MASNRIGGPSPTDPSKDPHTRTQEQHRKVEKVEKVKAVDEIENEHTRKKFQKFMSDEEEPQKPRIPSPLETGFYKDEETVFIDRSSPLKDFEDDAVPSPTYSPQPNVNIAPESLDDENPPLPQSHEFWKQAGPPVDDSPQSPHFKEMKTGGAKKNPHPSKKKEDSLYGPPGKPLGKHADKAKETSKSAISERVNEKKKQDSDEIKKEKKKTLNNENIPSHKKSMVRDDEEEKGGQKVTPIQLDSLPSEQLPSSIIPIAEAATTQASPYLSSETIPLFFQMVGTIYVMTAPPGISKTEIVLSSPAFANSKFFGSTISIEKYATAPDSLNIRLTGTNEAVKSFNENISNLYAAFQNGNFGFRIGRISAEYSVERPVFRRKESGEGRRESGGGDMSQERGKR